jgi:lipopolysaccharide assembly outer membrane protein LptD (OstA)
LRVNKGLTYKLLTVIWLIILCANYSLKAEGLADNYRGFSIALADTTEKDSIQEEESGWLETVLSYDANDSIKGDLINNKAYLYKDAYIEYGNINLTAGFIEIDWKTNEVRATGILDSNGKVIQKPVFTESDKVFETDTIVYNFDSQKARIKTINTQEGESYLAGQKVKKVGKDVYYIRGTSFTTCSHRHPHFRVRTQKAKVIVGKQIVTGPAYLEFADIPTPLVLPFGYFPTQDKRASGFIFPTFDFNSGNEINPGKGFGLIDGGYYWALSDHYDLKLTGSAYTKGGWGVRARSNYVKRYGYRGNVNIEYSHTKIGDPRYEAYGAFRNSKDFRMNWTHTQDPKARPDLRFNAYVNFATSNFNRLNTKDPNDYLQSTMTSSISLDKTWLGTPWSMTVGANHSQNNQNGTLDISLPKLSVNMRRVMPFARKKKVGDQAWYERVGVTYNMQGESQFSGELSDFDTINDVTRGLRYGLQHSVGISTNEKIFKHFSISPSFSYVNRFYPSKLNRTFNEDSNRVEVDTIHGFNMVQNFSVSANLATKIYGMFNYKRGKVKAIRHVMTPGVNFSFAPDFGTESWGYYQTVQTDTSGTTQSFSRYASQDGSYLYGAPGQGNNGSVTFSLLNVLEGKARTNDSIGEKKFKILDRLNFGTSYRLNQKEFAWSLLNIQAATALFKNKLNLTYQGQFDFYGLDTAGNRVNRSALEVNNKLLFNKRNNFSASITLKGKSERKSDVRKSATGLTDGDPNYFALDDYMDFVFPWSVTLGYNFLNVNTGWDKNVSTHSIKADFTVNPTPNWSLVASTGYDLLTNEITYTRFLIQRDLHCWELFLDWVPFGFNQSYNIGIRIKASQFKDVKYNQQRGIGDFN